MDEQACLMDERPPRSSSPGGSAGQGADGVPWPLGSPGARRRIKMNEVSTAPPICRRGPMLVRCVEYDEHEESSDEERRMVASECGRTSEAASRV